MKQTTINEIIDSSLQSKICVSVYLPLNNSQKNLRESENQLKATKKQIKSLLGSLKDSEVSSIMEKFSRDFHTITKLQLKHGAAWFYSELTCGYIPINWNSDPFVVVADSFHIKPVLRDHQIHRPFYVLLVGAKSIRLFSNYSEFLTLIEVVDPQIIGSAIDSKNLKEITRCVEKLLSRHCSKSNAPLVLAGSKVLVSRIDEEISYPFKISPNISCRPDSILLEELYKKSHKISKDHYNFLEDKVINDYQYCNKSNAVISDIQKISHAAISGQIQNLVVAEDHHVWGILNKESGSIKFHNEQMNSTDDDLLDDISEIVHRHHGAVWVVPKEKLNKSPIYATLRW